MVGPLTEWKTLEEEQFWEMICSLPNMLTLKCLGDVPAEMSIQEIERPNGGVSGGYRCAVYFLNPQGSTNFLGKTAVLVRFVAMKILSCFIYAMIWKRLESINVKCCWISNSKAQKRDLD